MASLRTRQGEEIYVKFRMEKANTATCPLCYKPALKTFKHWRIILNEFPYDHIATTHNMIVPVRHVTEKELNKEEIAEMEIIKEEYINKEYEFIIEATTLQKSIPGHFHLHLIIAKEI